MFCRASSSQRNIHFSAVISLNSWLPLLFCCEDGVVNSTNSGEVCAIWDYIMFPLTFCLFCRVFLPSLSPPDLSENPNLDLSHAFSNKLGPGAAGRHSELWAPARHLKFPSGSVEGELASFFVAASGGGSLSDSVEHGGM